MNKKLIPAFVGIALLIALVGAFGIRSMQTIHKNASSMYSQNLVSIEQMNKIKQNTLEIRYNLLKISNQENKENQNPGLEKEIQDFATEIDQILANYEKSSLTEEQKPTSTALRQPSRLTFQPADTVICDGALTGRRSLDRDHCR